VIKLESSSVSTRSVFLSGRFVINKMIAETDLTRTIILFVESIRFLALHPNSSATMKSAFLMKMLVITTTTVETYLMREDAIWEHVPRKTREDVNTIAPL
jgi:hypothetical protein